MDTTVVIEAWTSVITPMGFFGVILVQTMLIIGATVIGWVMGKEK